MQAKVQSSVDVQCKSGNLNGFNKNRYIIQNVNFSTKEILVFWWTLENQNESFFKEIIETI